MLSCFMCSISCVTMLLLLFPELLPVRQRAGQKGKSASDDGSWDDNSDKSDGKPPAEPVKPTAKATPKRKVCLSKLHIRAQLGLDSHAVDLICH